MSTSDRSRTLRQAAIAGAVAAAIAIVVSPANPAMADLPVHPAWVIALILAARHGARGLYAVPAIIVGVQLAEWISGRTGLGMFARLDTLGDLAALAAVAVLAGVGAAHEARKATLESRLRDAETRATTAETAIDELAEAAIALRDRSDRSQTSLAFLSDIAQRMDDPDPQGAGQAALDLAIARTGARGGLVQILEGGRLRTLTARGPWSAEHLTPPAVFRDRVAVAAIDRAQPVAAHEVAQVGIDDSDLAAPLLAEDGTVIGVLSLRGIAFPALTSAAREDLAAVARWAGRSFARPRRGAGPAALTVQGRGRAAT